jgi:hypothetical protein
MALFLFDCPQQNRIPGCVEKIVVRTPFWKAKIDPTGQQVFHPVTRKPTMEPDYAQTWVWLSQAAAQYGVTLPPSANFAGSILAPTPDINTPPSILCVQTTPASIQQHAPVHAPYGQPVGNPGQFAPPPMVDPNWKPGMPAPYRQDPFEALDASALPSTADSMLGEVDPSGGTFSDVDVNGNEMRRDERRPYMPK